MRNINFKIFGLLGILVLAAFLYFYKLDSIPNGLYVDEATTGYNAYSLLKTGNDEYGKAIPIAMRFFGSYSPPLYTYLTIPVVALKSLTVFATRFISAISGVLSVLIFFLLLESLNISKSKYTLLLGTFLFAISPWLIFYSRAGYELGLDYFFFSTSVFIFWLAIKNPKFLIPAVALFSISTYAGHTQRILAPVFILSVLFIFRKELLSKKTMKYLLSGTVLGAIIQIPHLTILTTPAFLSKTSLFYKDVVLSQAEKISNTLPRLIALPLAATREFFSQYLTYFSPRSLFFLPDTDPQRSIPELSVFYSWLFIPYLFGLYHIAKNKKNKKFKYILLLLLATPIPAALAADPFSTQRALPLLLPIGLTITLGMDRLIHKLKGIYWKPILLFLTFISFLLLWRSYFVFFPNERAKAWGYGFAELADAIRANPDTKYVIDQSRTKPVYIELAFYLKYPPEKFQQEVDQSIARNYYTNVDFSDNYKFANIETRNLNWQEDIYKEQVLVGDELAISVSQAKEHFLTKVFEIRDPIEAIIFQGYKTNPKAKCQHTQNLSSFCGSP